MNQIRKRHTQIFMYVIDNITSDLVAVRCQPKYLFSGNALGPPSGNATDGGLCLGMLYGEADHGACNGLSRCYGFEMAVAAALTFRPVLFDEDMSDFAGGTGCAMINGAVDDQGAANATPQADVEDDALAR